MPVLHSPASLNGHMPCYEQIYNVRFYRCPYSNAMPGLYLYRFLQLFLSVFTRRRGLHSSVLSNARNTLFLVLGAAPTYNVAVKAGCSIKILKIVGIFWAREKKNNRVKKKMVLGISVARKVKSEVCVFSKRVIGQ